MLAAIALIVVATASEITIRTLNTRYSERKLAEHGIGDRAALSFDALAASGEIASGEPFVFITGDSVTFGYNLKSFKHSYPFLLDQTLRRATAPPPLRVATSAFPGGNTLNEFYSFVVLFNEYRGVDVKLKFAVIGYCLNDAEGEHDFGLRGILSEAANRIAYKTKKNLTLSFYRKEPKNVARGLDGIARLARERGFPALVVIFPFFIPMDDYPLAKAHQMVARMARERGLLTLDLLPFYSRFPADALAASPGGDPIHPSPLAHKIAADAIFLEAVKRGWVEGFESLKNAAPAGRDDAARLCRELSRGESENLLASCLSAVEKPAREGKILKWRPPGGGEIMLFIP